MGSQCELLSLKPNLAVINNKNFINSLILDINRVLSGVAIRGALNVAQKGLIMTFDESLINFYSTL